MGGEDKDEAKTTARLWNGFLKYPSLRDVPLRAAATWIEGKRTDDDCGNLWRVHDKLYDLTDFVERHPGGAQWIRVSRGTDITEAYEAAHMNPATDQVLAKFYARPASGARNSPYTLKPDGFYMTFKRRVWQRLKATDAQLIADGKRRAARVQDALLAVFFVLFTLTIVCQSKLVAAVTGTVLFMNINCAHNYYHQRDGWRMFCWDLGLLSSYEWRITHMLSHHVFPNTVYDFELSGFEPFFNFKVERKNVYERWLVRVLCHLVFPVFFFSDFIKRAVLVATGRQRLRAENLLPLVQLVALMLAVSDATAGLQLWLAMQLVASYWFGFMGLIAAHHHPDMYHAGDGEPTYGRDWGLCQLDATRDRRDVQGNLLAEMTSYGNHALHHLLPTVDHGLLDLFHEDLVQTGQQFGIKDFVHEYYERYSQWDLLVGMFQQLARDVPRSAKTD